MNLPEWPNGYNLIAYKTKIENWSEPAPSKWMKKDFLQKFSHFICYASRMKVLLSSKNCPVRCQHRVSVRQPKLVVENNISLDKGALGVKPDNLSKPTHTKDVFIGEDNDMDYRKSESVQT